MSDDATITATKARAALDSAIRDNIDFLVLRAPGASVVKMDGAASIDNLMLMGGTLLARAQLLARDQDDDSTLAAAIERALSILGLQMHATN